MNRRAAALRMALAFPGGGLNAVAALMDKRSDTLRKELTGVAGYKWGSDDEELLMHLCVSAGMAPEDCLAPLTAMAANFGALLIPFPHALRHDDNSMRILAEAASEFGQFMHTMADAAADGRITANEVKRIDGESSELVAKIQACVAAMHAMHEAGRPAHLRAAA